ncbi:MAG TPA: flavodoxin family protein [Marinilabiliales bacterium]|jgi:multimeric flavodoxin WrbA|nr:flavodoxin family protein [Salinivirgaceae bacterium]OFX49486.1 MAG: FMN reductase [Bacteroidetes bacterium GWA2_40_14]OFX63293.1 MAG: FMN reductase [Bacteroidetes bacterium GWC2_40_13]OFX74601.1 MAG: FMN reductase [Bacteroidetes bacterium GWD2_40_43]OFX88975.1 MAG: FMN reductase [Bacteroidetes bacterium GWE2_40_63]OFY22781.1 MAG: FMN reductase [Bacteroidetes bacterium GWF2_40_13]OFZ32129.1 MAG: FMN reductase [Bacteroidetes bacterium RIFOXYC2_FULL_40_12]HAM98824.1 flavodoxin family protei
MKVIGINGSPNPKGNTSLMIQEVFKVLEPHGIETEFVQLGGKPVHGCTACMKCRELRDNRCHIKNDAINQALTKMLEADGILIGSPVYFSNVTTEIKALIDCAGYATRATQALKHKVGAALVAVRRAGEIHTFSSINHFFLINQMMVPGSTYWNIAIGRQPGDVLDDEEGMQTMRDLGENMAWLLKKVHS